MPDNVTVVVEVGDEDMAESSVCDLPERISSHLTTRLIQAGSVAHENFVNVSKWIDVDYLEGKRVIGMTEAMGAREVASKNVPAGPESK